ncbi:MAG: TetR family transcriptional regulator [Clostridia bacterium]|nr:TetR family transcriptional regulator [Clostridia bacterium]
MGQNRINARMRILFAARKLFAQQGFEATTVRQISEEAKTNLALISYHFGGKENVFFALFDTYFPIDSFYADFDFKDPVDGIKKLTEKMIEFKVEHPEMVCIIHQEILMNSPRLGEMSKYMYPVFTQLRDMLEAGKKQGTFHFKSIDNTMVFIMSIITFPLNNAFINPLLTDGKQDFESILTDTLNFVFDGLGYVGKVLHKSAL